MRPPLKVIAAGTALVSDDVALSGGNRFRYVGRSPVAAPRPGGPDAPETRPHYDIYPPVMREYPDDSAHRYILKSLRNGDLLPGDASTAARASVAFEPRTVRSKKEAV